MTYTIPANTEVEICDRREPGAPRWRPHTTSEQLTFSHWMALGDGRFVFLHKDLVIRVKTKLVEW